MSQLLTVILLQKKREGGLGGEFSKDLYKVLYKALDRFKPFTNKNPRYLAGQYK